MRNKEQNTKNKEHYGLAPYKDGQKFATKPYF